MNVTEILEDPSLQQAAKALYRREMRQRTPAPILSTVRRWESLTPLTRRHYMEQAAEALAAFFTDRGQRPPAVVTELLELDR